MIARLTSSRGQSPGAPEPTRRCFLKASAALSFAAGLRVYGADSAPEAGAPPARTFKISLNPGLLGIRLGLRDSIALASRFGFDAVAPAPGELAHLPADQLEQLLADLKAKHLVWGAAGIGTPSGQSDESFKASLAKLPDMAAALQKAGATRVGTWITPGDNRLTYLENFRRHLQRARQIATIFDGHGIRFGLEYVAPKTSRTRWRFEFIHTMREMRELIARIDRPNVGLTIDSWHWYNAGESPADVRALRGRDVVWVHLNDAPAGIAVDRQVDNHRTLPAATGVINIGGFVGALTAIGYDGPAAAEPFMPELRRMPAEKAVQLAAEAIHKAVAQVGR